MLVGLPRPAQYLPPLSLLLSLLLSLSLSRLRSLPPPRLLSRLRLRPLFLSCSISSCRRSILGFLDNLRSGHLEIRSIPDSVISLALPSIQFPTKLPADRFEMHEVAEARSGALPSLVLTTTGLAEVCHGGQLSVYRPSSKPTIVEVTAGFLSVLKEEDC